MGALGHFDCFWCLEGLLKLFTSDGARLGPAGVVANSQSLAFANTLSKQKRNKRESKNENGLGSSILLTAAGHIIIIQSRTTIISSRSG
jgi:hypothetical protein